jgi:hypothetical protein
MLKIRDLNNSLYSKVLMLIDLNYVSYNRKLSNSLMFYVQCIDTTNQQNPSSLDKPHYYIEL